VVGALALIVVGVLLFLNQNGVLRFSEIWRLWPMLLVIGGLVRLAQFGSTSKFMGGLMIAIGIVLELSEFDLIPYRIWELWPLGIIAVGLILLWQSLQPKQEGEERAPWCRAHFGGPLPIADNLSIFGGGQRRISDKDFTKADILAVFGGYTLDLRKAAMKENRAVVDATAVFGGIEIQVPESWNVVVRGVGIFGGYGDETHHTSEPAPDLLVQGVAIFGGVVVKN
jgi:predicted membrane protein